MGGCCANSHPAQVGIGSLPSVEVVVNGIPVVALLDTGCTTSLVQSGIASFLILIPFWVSDSTRGKSNCGLLNVLSLWTGLKHG